MMGTGQANQRGHRWLAVLHRNRHDATAVGAGSTVPTDPNFPHHGQWSYFGQGLFSRRHTEHAAQPADLPPLTTGVAPTSHGDHFDRRDAPVTNSRPVPRVCARAALRREAHHLGRRARGCANARTCR